MLKAERPFKDPRDGDTKQRFIGDEYLFKGPGTYKPRIEESVTKKIEMTLILPDTAIVLKAKRNLIDASGTKRIAGEKVGIIEITSIVVAQETRLLLTID